MPRMPLASTFGLALLLAACNSAPSLPPADQETYPTPQETRDWEEWGEDRPDTPPTGGGQRATLRGERLNDAGIRRALSGQTLRGCYPNGQRFAERLANDGKFYDAANGDTLLGDWYVRNDTLCFRYPDRARAGEPDGCFAVSREGGELYFYTADLTGLVAATTCQAFQQ